MSDLDVSKSSVTNGKATTSLILGVISILLVFVPFLGLILGVIGLILGIIGLIDIKDSKQVGKKLAISGIVCSSLGILLPLVLAVIAYLALTNVAATLS